VVQVIVVLGEVEVAFDVRQGASWAQPEAQVKVS
jgi:hypothetical protein